MFDQFSVVRHKPGGRAKGDPDGDELVAVPYHLAYAEDMKAASSELRAAAGVLAKGLGAAVFVVDHFLNGSPTTFLLFAATDGTLALLTLALLARRS